MKIPNVLNDLAAINAGCGHNPNRVTQLTALQKLWIKYRDANCEFYYDPDGGSLARILSNDCMLTMTKDRAIEFEMMLKN